MLSTHVEGEIVGDNDANCFEQDRWNRVGARSPLASDELGWLMASPTIGVILALGTASYFDIRFENLYKEIRPTFTPLQEDQFSGKLQDVPLSENSLVIVLSSSTATQAGDYHI